MEQIKQVSSKQMTDEFVNKISYSSQNVKLKVTYALEWNSQSGELVFGNLVDIIDAKYSESENENRSIFVTKFFDAGYKLKEQQIKELNKLNFDLILEEFEVKLKVVEKTIRMTPSIGQATYKNLVEFIYFLTS